MLALIAWLAMFWFLSSTIWHRAVLGFLVIPSLALLPGSTIWPCLKSRWLMVAACLLAWQLLSREWSGGENSPPGWWLDALLVFGLLCALLTVARRRFFAALFAPVVSMVSALVSLVSLVVFYWPAARSLSDDRLRNVFFHEHGLNAVPTGFLFAFGALVTVWWMIPSTTTKARLLISLVLTSSLVGLLATQSRGPMLMFFAGLLVAFWFAGRRATPALSIIGIVTLSFITILLISSDGRDATLDLVQRGTTGRSDIYRWFLGQMTFRDFLFGSGMARAPVMPADSFGWEALHPHSIYLTQLYQTGIVGLAMLVGLIGAGIRAAVVLANRDEPLWLCLLGGSSVALIFDGAQVFTVYSIPRVEILLVVVPAAIAIGRSANETIT